RCRSPLLAASALVERNHTPACLAISAALPTVRASKAARFCWLTALALASRARPGSSASCRSWWDFSPLFRAFQRRRNLNRCFGAAETNVDLQPDQQHTQEDDHRTDRTLDEHKDVTT